MFIDVCTLVLMITEKEAQSPNAMLDFPISTIKLCVTYFKLLLLTISALSKETDFFIMNYI